MSVYPATKTLAKIDAMIKADQGASFRGWLGKVIPHMDDAYKTDTFPFRSHLGASGIGKECPREIWYGFRWTSLSEHDARLLRLFNRGHLEEARFIAMLLMIGAEVYQQDENGKQFKISDAGGHFGGSGDGIVVNLPDLESGVAALAEFKTSAEKPFVKVKKEGVKSAKFEHYVQMQVYMRKMGIAIALYMVVNKNNDELYGELVPFDAVTADQYIDRGVRLVWVDEPPPKISNSPGWFACKFCDHKDVCHLRKEPYKTCRSCKNSIINSDGTWSCSISDELDNSLSKDEQLKACDKYVRAF